MMDEAIVLYAGEEAEEIVTKAGVIKGLLETAGVEYSEAVENGQIIEMIDIPRCKCIHQPSQRNICNNTV